MPPLSSFREYLFNLHTTNSAEARRLWRKHIKESWENRCAYCNSEENLTIDHIIPQSKGGIDFTENVVCCCHSCNQSKGNNSWKEWYFSQEFFDQERYKKILNWTNFDKLNNLVTYGKRKNFIN